MTREGPLAFECESNGQQPSDILRSGQFGAGSSSFAYPFSFSFRGCDGSLHDAVEKRAIAAAWPSPRRRAIAPQKTFDGHIVAGSFFKPNRRLNQCDMPPFTLRHQEVFPPLYERGIQMITRYLPAASLTAAALSLMFLSSPASAQQAMQEKQPTQEQRDSNGTAATVSDQKIEAFTVAYLQVDKIRQEYSAKIGATSDPAAKQQLQTEASKQMVQAVQTSPGMSVDEYNAILAAANKDPALVKKVQDRLQKSAPAQQ